MRNREGGLMGKQRFRLSHMIPNAWFYRLRDMNHPLPSASKQQPRNSFCYTPRVHQLYTSPTPTANTQPLGSIYTRPYELTHTDEDLFLSPTSCTCEVISSSTVHVLDFNQKRIQDSSGYPFIQEIELQKPPPIKTKCKDCTLTTVEKKEETCSPGSVSIKVVEENPVVGVKIRPNSPSRTPVCKRAVDVNNDEDRRKKNLSGSCCMVKASFDPQQDFKESMVEMIAENNMWTSKDLENLLVCYLSLNPKDYHGLIVKAFEEIWLSLDAI